MKITIEHDNDDTIAKILRNIADVIKQERVTYGVTKLTGSPVTAPSEPIDMPPRRVVLDDDDDDELEESIFHKKKIKEGVGSDLEDVSSFEKPSIMQYTAKWQEYQGPLITIRFKARSDEEALKKIFLKKVVKDEGNDTLEEWCEEYEIPITDINQKWLEEYFDDIDISGWPYLDELTNLTRGETVYTSGYESSGDDEDWDDDE